MVVRSGSKKAGRKRRPLILVSNDDGIRARGLLVLMRRLKELGRVVAVVPQQQQSASSHSITLHRPLRMEKLGRDVYGVDGTPTDCIMLGIHEILHTRPNLIVSGINHGANLGDDVHYSGTVSAAVEGGVLGIPSIAVSLVTDGRGEFAAAADFAVRLARKVLNYGLTKGVILNVNVPDLPARSIAGYEFTRLGKRDYGNIIVEKVDPRGKKYYWIGGDHHNFEDIINSDCNAVRAGKISITPLRVNLTARDTLKKMIHWKL